MITPQEENYLVLVQHAQHTCPAPDTSYKALAEKLFGKGYLEYDGFIYTLSKKGESYLNYLLEELK